MKTNYLDYIDFDRLNMILDGFYQSSGYTTVLVDFNGILLSKSEWGIVGENYLSKTRLNNVCPLLMPIVIKGETVANLMLGHLIIDENEEERYFEPFDEITVSSNVKISCVWNI